MNLINSKYTHVRSELVYKSKLMIIRHFVAKAFSKPLCLKHRNIIMQSCLTEDNIYGMIGFV